MSDGNGDDNGGARLSYETIAALSAIYIVLKRKCVDRQQETVSPFTVVTKQAARRKKTRKEYTNKIIIPFITVDKFTSPFAARAVLVGARMTFTMTLTGSAKWRRRRRLTVQQGQPLKISPGPNTSARPGPVRSSNIAIDEIYMRTAGCQ